MGRKLEWELSGKSDVPQKMAQAKASMEGVEGAANAVGKKFKEAFKDIALGFVAPMVLVQKAIGFIGEALGAGKLATRAVGKGTQLAGRAIVGAARPLERVAKQDFSP